MTAIQVFASLSLFVSGGYLGYRLAMHEVANRKPADRVEPTTKITLVTDPDGTVRFSGSITAIDFMDAVHDMNPNERRIFLSEPGAEVSVYARTLYLLNGLVMLYTRLAKVRGRRS